jgi:hypothetical protein
MATTPNDAALIAQSLQVAGFDVGGPQVPWDASKIDAPFKFSLVLGDLRNQKLALNGNERPISQCTPRVAVFSANHHYLAIL